MCQSRDKGGPDKVRSEQWVLAAGGTRTVEHNGGYWPPELGFQINCQDPGAPWGLYGEGKQRPR